MQIAYYLKSLVTGLFFPEHKCEISLLTTRDQKLESRVRTFASFQGYFRASRSLILKRVYIIEINSCSVIKDNQCKFMKI